MNRIAIMKRAFDLHASVATRLRPYMTYRISQETATLLAGHKVEPAEKAYLLGAPVAFDDSLQPGEIWIDVPATPRRWP